MDAATATEVGFIHHVEAPRDAAPRRALLLLHGTGGNEHDLVPLGRALAPDAVLISPRGKVLERGAPRFFRRFAEGMFDEADVIARAAELAAWAKAAAGRHARGLPLAALGFSNGANIAAAVMLLHPDVLDEAVLLRAMPPLSAPPVADLSGRRVLILNGLADPIATPEIAERLAGQLRAAGAALTARMLPAGHGLTQADLDAAAAFLR
ncbi:alpha/beta hydrolase [Elioraea rosea]|uniref:alpha/beta hydrolase n=1 Tax=Elioraea rosea TaxID=2492390 RepID=UPI0011836B69|nr:alpha/beta hydrolase [Elioraea rosea]